MLGMATTFSLDDGVSRGSLPLYDFGAKRIVFRDVPLPIRTGPWRGLGAGPNALAIELAVSRLAAVADVDPVEFRLRHLADESRLARCIRRVAEASGWSESNRGALPDGSSLGIGAGIYKGTTFAAAVARVARRDGELHVTDIWCAHDCGLVVNPDQVAAQVEGNLMWATSSVLLEELPIGHSIVDASNFSDSPILRIDDAPRIHVDLVDNAVDPGGAGESAIVPGFGAVANAWERATDEPITRIPVRST
jgi:isoquinoline 1-oxidoreductase beta subunit